MKEKRFYKNEIKVSNEYIVFEDLDHESENIVYITNPSLEDRAILRSYFAKELEDEFGVDIYNDDIILVKVKKQHYIIVELFYNSVRYVVKDTFYLDDFIILTNSNYIVFVKRPTFSGTVVLNVNFYDFQPTLLLVSEFTYKNFTSNPSVFSGSNVPYASGIVGFDKKGNVVYYGKFSQPLLVNDAYVFLQRILIPTYSKVRIKGSQFISLENININLHYPVYYTQSPDILLYRPDFIDEEDIVIEEIGFMISSYGAFAVNLHDDVDGEVGIVSDVSGYRMINTTSIRYGGVEVEGTYVYYLDYYDNENTLSIYRYDVLYSTLSLFLTFSNKNSKTFSSLQFDRDNRIFFVSADNGTYFISLSSIPFITFSDYFGVNARYFSYNRDASGSYLGRVFYTDGTYGIKSSFYTKNAPYILTQTTSFISDDYGISFFDTDKSTTSIYYVTTSESFNVVKSNAYGTIVYSTSENMGAIARTLDEKATVISYASGSAYALALVKEVISDSGIIYSYSFVNFVPKFVREIKHFTNSIVFSEFDFEDKLANYHSDLSFSYLPVVLIKSLFYTSDIGSNYFSVFPEEEEGSFVSDNGIMFPGFFEIGDNRFYGAESQNTFPHLLDFFLSNIHFYDVDYQNTSPNFFETTLLFNSDKTVISNQALNLNNFNFNTNVNLI